MIFMEENKIPDLFLGDPLEVPQAPTLTLESEEEQAVAPKKEASQAIDYQFTEKEKAAVTDFANKIDIANSAQMLQYGSAAQKKMVSFSEQALENVRSKDLDVVGKMITELAVEIKGFSPDEDENKGGFLGFFKKSSNKIDTVRAKYDTVENNVERISDELDKHKIRLLKDISVLDKMYEMNLDYFKELTMYIAAGREKLKLTTENELKAARDKAIASGSTQEAQVANDLAEQCNRFEKKLYDLELTRNICLQMGPQIRLVQSNDTMMVEKIQSTIVNTIPLWKNQMVLTLGLSHSKNAIEAQRRVTDLTNELLKKNAETLKVSTIEAAKESERGIVDIETLKQTNESLISTLDEVMQIQQQGKEKRREAEAELAKIENDLKYKLLEIRDNSKKIST